MSVTNEDLAVMIGEVRGKIDSALTNQERMMNDHKDLAVRVVATERWQNYHTGAISVVLAGLGLLTGHSFGPWRP